jgi:hypothetical protein
LRLWFQAFSAPRYGFSFRGLAPKKMRGTIGMWR